MPESTALPRASHGEPLRYTRQVNAPLQTGVVGVDGTQAAVETTVADRPPPADPAPS
jgi:hypothetical protein